MIETKVLAMGQSLKTPHSPAGMPDGGFFAVLTWTQELDPQWAQPEPLENERILAPYDASGALTRRYLLATGFRLRSER